MNEKEINEYIEKLIETKGADLEGLEFNALQRYTVLVEQIEFVEKKLMRLQQEVERNVALMQRLKGQSEAYVNLLILAENDRRDEKAKMAVAQKIQGSIKSGKSKLVTLPNKDNTEQEAKR